MAREALHLVKVFPRAEVTSTQIRHVADQLPGWEHSLFWKVDQAGWLRLQSAQAH